MSPPSSASCPMSWTSTENSRRRSRSTSRSGNRAAASCSSPGSIPPPRAKGRAPRSVGLADALRRRGKKTVLCIREPSLGPVFGVKGGAAGGGYAQVIPMEDINLHFTGDFHAISSAHSLLSAMLDNHLHAGESAQHRLAPHHLAAHDRHERPRAAQRGHRARRRRQRHRARGALGDHPGERDHGDRGARIQPRRSRSTPLRASSSAPRPAHHASRSAPPISRPSAR